MEGLRGGLVRGERGILCKGVLLYYVRVAGLEVGVIVFEGEVDSCEVFLEGSIISVVSRHECKVFPFGTAEVLLRAHYYQNKLKVLGNLNNPWIILIIPR